MGGPDIAFAVPVCRGPRAHLAAVQDLAVAGAATSAAEVHVAVAVILWATCSRTGSAWEDAKCGLWSRGGSRGVLARASRCRGPHGA